MELHIQKCQACGSRALRNILVRDRQQKVFAQCRDCGSLVARYVLAAGGYFHEGKDFESFLRSIERDGAISSGRAIEDMFSEARGQSLAEFKNALEQLNARHHNKLP